MVPFCCFLSGVEDEDEGKALHLCDGEGEGFRSSWAEGEGAEAGRLSRGERAGLGRPSAGDGEVLERGVGGPPLPLPFRSFSDERWGEGDVREPGLWRDGADEPRRTWDAEVVRLRQGIFSRLTTGRDTHDLLRAPLGGYTARGALLKRACG